MIYCFSHSLNTLLKTSTSFTSDRRKLFTTSDREVANDCFPTEYSRRVGGTKLQDIFLELFTKSHGFLM